MNDKTSQLERLTSNLNSTMEWVGANVGDATDLVKREAPLVAKEIVALQITLSVFHLAVVVVFFLVCLGISAYLLSIFRQAKDEGQRLGFGGGAAIALAIGLFFLLVVGIHEGGDLIRAVTAPRIVIIDYIKQHIR